MIKIILLIIFFIISLCLSIMIVVCKDSDREIAYLESKLSQIKIDSVFSFSVIVEEKFDSLYFFYPYMNRSEISDNINMSEREKKYMWMTLGHDFRQAIFFTKNKNVVFRAYITSDTVAFYSTVLGFNGFSPDARFKMTKDESGRKQLVW